MCTNLTPIYGFTHVCICTQYQNTTHDQKVIQRFTCLQTDDFCSFKPSWVTGVQYRICPSYNMTTAPDKKKGRPPYVCPPWHICHLASNQQWRAFCHWLSGSHQCSKAHPQSVPWPTDAALHLCCLPGPWQLWLHSQMLAWSWCLVAWCRVSAALAEPCMTQLESIWGLFWLNLQPIWRYNTQRGSCKNPLVEVGLNVPDQRYV